MQTSLFSEPEGVVEAAPADAGLHALGQTLPERLYLGTSSWNFPGWRGLVWDRDYPEATLARFGLPAYARHPLFRTVCIDRSFYRPLAAAEYAEYAAQVPAGFRFMVKAPAQITDALVRDQSGRGRARNPDFLNAELALREFIEPVVAGLREKLGAVVFQISPLPEPWLAHVPELLEQLRSLLSVIPDLRADAPDSVVAVEVRNAEWLKPQFVEVLRESGATYCLGLHANMPVIADQLPLLRALWPGPLVCRWNLHALHGAYGFEAARQRYEPYDRLVDEDL
ncbi:MAG: DUF72 domain-containing protein, partial [Spongiibacteraceae bacterium]|nr:DUF72 domain-containing protein [Spongiibacteraceae bacterium]